METDAICIWHVWKEDAEADPEVNSITNTETAYPTILFQHQDSSYIVNIDPYYYEKENGKKGYLITGNSLRILYFPDDPTRRVVPVGSGAQYWTPIVYLIIFISISILIFFWIDRTIKDL